MKRHTTVTVENEYEIVSITDKEHGGDITATCAMLALSYHHETARRVFSDEVEL